LILENFETLSEEGIQFEKTVGYVRLDGLAAPVPRRKRFDYYLYVDLKIELLDDGEINRVQSELPLLRDAALRELHKGSLMRTDGVLGVDLRAMKKRLVQSMNTALGEPLISKVLISKLTKAAG
jgi:flagellar basal body-associated protein FliL